MKTAKRIHKHLYFEGNYQIEDFNSNYACPCKFPTIFTAFGKGIKSGNWRSCTAINTPDSIKRFYNEEFNANIQSNYDIKLVGLSENENYEFYGLVTAISNVAEAYTVFKFGNHGNGDQSIVSKKCAKAIFEAIKPMIERANVLLNKLPTV